jgi:uroporphyrinogen decarboxylase
LKKETGSKLLNTLAGETEQPPALWLMRQAGRYLPEYRAARERAGSFWSMCMTPERAAEVTLQPIERFGFDAAIIFSDIMVVPFAMGCDVSFEEGVGPRLKPVDSVDALVREETTWTQKLAPCYEALRLVRGRLDKDRALLGFAGAPWTLATYLAEGGGSRDQLAAKLWGYRDGSEFSRLLEILGDCVAHHLIAQIDVGADAVQLFDSWASGLTPACFRDWVIAPTKHIVDVVKAARPEARIIGFPRGATCQGYEAYARGTGVDAVSLDTAVAMDWAADVIGSHATIQGNLDPIALVAGGAPLRNAVECILNATRKTPFIFNLGHGILPQTPLEHVYELVAQVRSGG